MHSKVCRKHVKVRREVMVTRQMQNQRLDHPLQTETEAPPN